jgi:predicted membrane channel-forming protein YqfA (hemolysin III family)
METFFKELRQQRWDDHRYYHHSLINQTLHLISAISFICAYAMLFVDPALAALIGWLISMTTRQSGHFFFEPKGYDEVNQATHEHKEDIKVGFNLRRKVILHLVWGLSPLLLWLSPTLWGLVAQAQSTEEMIRNVALLWLYLALAGIILRTVQLFFIRDVTYYKAPFYLFKGERLAPRAQSLTD